MFDYVMNPIICVIWCGKATVDLHVLPFVPVWAWFIIYALLFTGLNLRGIEASARTNAILAVGLGIVILLFFAAAIRYLFHQPPPDAAALGRPFYDPATFSWGALSSGAALAVLTYIVRPGSLSLLKSWLIWLQLSRKGQTLLAAARGSGTRSAICRPR